jgi:hypothetical protein
MTTTTATWNQLGNTLTGVNDDDRFGRSVSINGDGSIVAIGANFNDGVDTTNTNDDRGSTTMYKYNTTTNKWDQLGQILYGEASGDNSGYSVSLNCIGNIVAIGAYQNDGTDTNQDDDRGHVRVYEYNSSSQSWDQLGKNIDGEAAGDRSGNSVSLNSTGTIVAIGAYLNDGIDTTDTDRGHVRVYEYNSSSQSWVKLGKDIDGEAAGDFSGWSVSLNSTGTLPLVHIKMMELIPLIIIVVMCVYTNTIVVHNYGFN